MNEETWKDVVGYEGLYMISSQGRVKRLARVNIDKMGRRMPYKEIILKTLISGTTGYPYVGLSKDGSAKVYNIHRLIAEAFIPNPDNLPCVNHIDQNRSNSVLSNLEWCDYSYNNTYGDANAKRFTSIRKFWDGKHKPIYQFDLSGNLIATYDCGVNQVEEKFGFSIQDNLTNRVKTSHGFVFSYSPVFEYEEDRPQKHQKYVILLDKEGNEIKRYKSVSEAGRENGFDRHKFSRTPAIDGIKTIYGKRFIVEEKENEYIPVGHKGPRYDRRGKNGVAVCQYTLDGEFVAEYACIKEAARSIGKPKGGPSITSCCRKNLMTAFGYIWRYKGELSKANVA